MVSDYKKLFNNNDFKHLWNSQILSQITINVLNFLLLVRIFEETGSTIATSMLWIAYALPAIIIGPFAAASVDVFDRRKLLIITNLFQSITIFIYTYSHMSSLYLLYGVAIIYSLFNQFYVPAELASLPEIVKKKNYAFANGLFLITQQASVVVGFGMAGFLRGLLGFTKSLYLCSLFLLIALISVYRLPSMRRKKKTELAFEKVIKQLYLTVLEGYKYLSGNKKILAPIALLLLMQTILTVVLVNVPVLAEDILKIDVNLIGVVLAVPAGIGAGLGAVLIPKTLKKVGRKLEVIELSLIILTIAVFHLTFFIPKYPSSGRFWVGILNVILIGWSYVGVIVPTQTFLQEHTPRDLMGRVIGNYWFIATIVAVFPVIFSGTITELFGIKFLLFIVGTIFLSILIFLIKFGRDYLSINLSS